MHVCAGLLPHGGDRVFQVLMSLFWPLSTLFSLISFCPQCTFHPGQTGQFCYIKCFSSKSCSPMAGCVPMLGGPQNRLSSKTLASDYLGLNLARSFDGTLGSGGWRQWAVFAKRLQSFTCKINRFWRHSLQHRAYD